MSDLFTRTLENRLADQRGGGTVTPFEFALQAYNRQDVTGQLGIPPSVATRSAPAAPKKSRTRRVVDFFERNTAIDELSQGVQNLTEAIFGAATTTVNTAGDTVATIGREVQDVAEAAGDTAEGLGKFLSNPVALAGIGLGAAFLLSK